MKKIIILGILGMVMMSCTNTKLVQYNTKRLDNIEEYLKENREVTGKNKEYIPLEREADKWEKNQ
jgi:ribosomal protein S2